MAIDFPASPTSGQLFLAPNQVTYQWSSTYTAWLPLAVTSAGVGDFFATGGTIPTTTAVIVYPNVVSGNNGGWYNASTGRFTPPAGRYRLCAGFSGANSGAAANLSINLYKNGFQTVSSFVTTAAASFTGYAAVEIALDSNGTDFWDVRAAMTPVLNSGQGTSYFGAFPISAAGPAAGTGSSWRQIARVVPTAAQADVSFQNIPADINSIELWFDVIPTATGSQLLFRYFDGAGAIVTSGYGFTGQYTTSTATTGA